MTIAHLPAEPTPEESEAMLELARKEAQDRVAELHVEEGTVKSEGGTRNSPGSEDKG